MDDTPPGGWLEPWRAINRPDQEAMERELRKELMPGHPLFRMAVHSVARGAGDDVLFVLDNCPHRYAVVHLVWQGPQQLPWPDPALYLSFAEWVEKRMKPDHAALTGRQTPNESRHPLEPH